VVNGNINGTGATLLPGLTTSNVTVSGSTNGYVTVSASYTFQPIFASLPTFGYRAPISLAVPLNATVVMKAL